MIRNIAAVVVGLATAFILIMAIQKLGHIIYPPPVNLDTHDADAMRTYISQLPLLALLFPIIAYIAGAFCGPLLACYVGTARPVVFAVIIGVVLLAATISNLILIPHPLWFSILAVLAVVVATWFALQAGNALRGDAAD